SGSRPTFPSSAIVPSPSRSSSATVAGEPAALDRSATVAFTIRISSGGGSRNTLASVSLNSSFATLHVHGAGVPSGGGAGGVPAVALGRPARGGRGGV